MSSGEIRVVCPSCGAKLRLPAFTHGKRLKCSRCQAAFLAPEAASLPSKPPSAPSIGLASETPMPDMTLAAPPRPFGPTQPEPISPLAETITPVPDSPPVLPIAPTLIQPAPAHRPPAVTREVTNAIGMKLLLVPRGKFLMGSPVGEKGHLDDEAQHEVEITQRFYVAVYAVTQAEYTRVMRHNPSWFIANGGGKDKIAGLDTDRLPVESVSWHDAQEFCRKLSDLPEERRAGRSYGLPTEAEWEYVCRGGPQSTTAPFHYGTALSTAQANCDGRWPYGGAPKGRSLERPAPVGSYPPNALGCFDLHGNVWEWCQDWYDKDAYQTGPSRDPQGPSSSPERCRVLRGGSWGDGAQLCRAACRVREEPSGATIFIGFRVVMTTGSLGT